MPERAAQRTGTGVVTRSGTGAALRPQHHSVPSTLRAQDLSSWSAFVTTVAQSVSLPIRTGASVGDVLLTIARVPSPRMPWLAQHHSVPVFLTAQNSPPTATVCQSRSVPIWTGVVASPPGNAPQHHRVPSSWIAHVLG